MAERSAACDLCGLPLPANPVEATMGGEQRHFCCEGCARVYEIAQDSGMLEVILRRAGTAAEPAAEAKPATSQAKETAFFDIQGMWCAGCGVAAERVLRSRRGVKEADVSFAVERGRIVYDPDLVQPEELFKVLSPLGYRARITSTKEEQQQEKRQNRLDLQLMAALAFGMEVMVLYLVQLYPLYATGQYASEEARRIQYIVWAMTTPIVFYSGKTFLVGAWRSLRAGTVGMDTLVALGVLASYFYSAWATLTGKGETYFDTSGMIVSFILIGRYLESIGGARARKDIRSLLHLQPNRAWRKSPDGWEQVQAAALLSGDTILIKPGERVPADAEVLEGEASADESMLTGESLPVAKDPGSLVYAGTLVREGALTARVTHPPGNTRLAQISDLMARTLSQKPRIQRLADQASTYFAVGILLASAGAFAGWLLLSGSPGKALEIAVAVLVVACPCALGLATPLAMTVTMGRAALNGILVKNPEAMETSPAVKRIVFDKTGTLTRGRLSVAAAVPAEHSRLNAGELLQLAAAVEQYSEHPLARAIVQASPAPPGSAAGFVSLRGAGATARVPDERGAHVSVGSARLVSVPSDEPLAEAAAQAARRGETVVWVARDGRVEGFLTLRDEPNRSARPALEMLRAEGIETALLSGDTPQAAEAVARDLGIAMFSGGCSPEEKAAQVAGWQREGLRVGMAGDGVNDAPALAQADLSITAAGGSDIAGQASDLVLTRPDLTLIPWFIQRSRRTRRTILQNLGWAFAYNLVAVPLAMLGLINPIIAAVAMAASSIVVVVNSLRLRR